VNYTIIATQNYPNKLTMVVLIIYKHIRAGNWHRITSDNL